MTRLARTAVLPLAAAFLGMVAAIPTGAGERDCSIHAAWPHGPRLGHQNAWIRGLSFATHGKAAFQAWAVEHHASVIEGLHGLGHKIERPPEAIPRVDELTIPGLGGARGAM